MGFQLLSKHGPVYISQLPLYKQIHPYFHNTLYTLPTCRVFLQGFYAFVYTL